jgi:hypothetical protein
MATLKKAPLKYVKVAPKKSLYALAKKAVKRK